MNDRLFTYDDLAERFQVSKSWLWKQVRQGRLMPIRYSTRVSRFTEREVMRFEGTSPLPGRFHDFTPLDQVVEKTVMGSDGKP